MEGRRAPDSQERQKSANRQGGKTDSNRGGATRAQFRYEPRCAHSLSPPAASPAFVASVCRQRLSPGFCRSCKCPRLAPPPYGCLVVPELFFGSLRPTATALSLLVFPLCVPTCAYMCLRLQSARCIGPATLSSELPMNGCGWRCTKATFPTEQSQQRRAGFIPLGSQRRMHRRHCKNHKRRKDHKRRKAHKNCMHRKHGWQECKPACPMPSRHAPR